MSSATVAMGAPARPGAGTCVAVGNATGSVAVPATAFRSTAVRLTRRGRAVLGAGLLVVALVLGLLIKQSPSLAGDEFRAGAQYEYVVVEPGQTLWQIAVAAAPDVDPRVTIMRIQDLNGLSDAAVAAGQRIALPPSS